MDTTATYVAHMVNTMKARLAWIDTVAFIGRQDPTGVITNRDEDNLGIDDTEGNKMYVRYTGDDHTYKRADRPKTSRPTKEVTASLRLVFIHKCENDDEIERAIQNEMELAPFAQGAPKYHVNVQKSSKDKQGIFNDETKQGTTANLSHQLMRFDFTITYDRVVNPDPDCIPTCRGC